MLNYQRLTVLVSNVIIESAAYTHSMGLLEVFDIYNFILLQD